MDKEKFKQFIMEVAEIKELKPVTSGERPAEGDTEVLYKGEWITLDKKVNPTLGFKFVKLKKVFNNCELGCGRVIANQSFEKRLYDYPEKHWRTKCNNCGQFQGPDGRLIQGGSNTQAEFMKYFNNKK